MATKIVNIRRDVDDKFYRYRMPLLTTKIEGKGNGIKTVIPNMSDVARALSRPPTYPTKYFGCELGAQTTFDEKNDRYIVNGAHSAERLRELLDGFIDKFVLCGSCKNPETEILVFSSGKGRGEDISKDCKACGERTGVDMRHRLTTFIVKNPPVKAKKGKKVHNNGDAAAGVGGNGNPDPTADKTSHTPPNEDSGNDDDDDILTKKIKAEAAGLSHDTELAKEDWSADTSPEAVEARAKALEARMGSIMLGGGGEDGEDEGDDANKPYSVLGSWIEELKSKETDLKTRPGAIYKKAEELGIEKKHKAMTVLVQALFTEDGIMSEIDQYAPLFTKMSTSEKHQKSLLGGLERLIGLSYPSLLPQTPKILMAFYQKDLIEEEVIKAWGTHVSKKYVDRETSKKVRKAGEPFLKWLDEAEDDEDDDE